MTVAAELDDALSARLSDGTRCLTVDISGLSFADTASVRALVLTARSLKTRGGELILVRPQPAVARLLALLGADQAFTIQSGSSAKTRSAGEAMPAGGTSPGGVKARGGTGGPAVSE